MANVIKHKRGSGSDPSASDLVVGEVAIRTDVGKLFTKMDNGSVAEIAGGGSDIAINTLSSSSATGGGSATFNGSAYRFTLSAPPSVSAQQLLVSINGVIQKPVAGTGQPSEGFSVDGTDIILGDAPATGSDFFILTFKSLGVSEPADNSVTSAKIVDGAIVNADINASAAIQGTKISPNFGSQNIITTGEIKITNAQPGMVFEDTGANPDFIIQNRDGSFAIRDTTNAANRFLVNMANGAITGTGDMTIDTDTLHVDSSNDRVGIGTTSPATTLAVKSSGANTNQITLVDHDSTNEVFRVGQQSDGDGFLQLVQDEGTVGVSFDASGNSYFNGGNVGIGTSTIGEKLTIGDGDLKFFNSDAANNHRTTFIEFQNSSNRITSESNFGSDGSSGYAAGYKFSTKNYTGSAFETLTPFVIQANGNVGIGTTSPAAHLHLDGGTSGVQQLRVQNHSSIGSFSGNYGSEFRHATSASNHAMLIHAHEANDARRTLDISDFNGIFATFVNGKVGIGTTTPDTLLDVSSSDDAVVRIQSEGTDATDDARLEIKTTNGTFTIQNDRSLGTSGALTFAGNTSNNLVIDHDIGNVGIGTASPLRTLHTHVSDSGANYHQFTNSTTGAGANDGAYVGIDATENLILWNQENNKVRFATNNTERGMITSSGFTKFTSASGNYFNSTANFHEFRSSANNNANIVFLHTGVGNTQYGISIRTSNEQNDTSHYYIDCREGGSSTRRFIVYANGDVENQNQSYGQLSDIKLKENVVDANSQWNDIKQLKVKNFNFKNDSTKLKQIGLIAQEAEIVCPGLVYERVDQEEDAVTGEIKDKGTTTKGLKYSVLYMKAIKALQEAMTRIETLEAKVEALEAK